MRGSGPGELLSCGRGAALGDALRVSGRGPLLSLVTTQLSTTTTMPKSKDVAVRDPMDDLMSRLGVSAESIEERAQERPEGLPKILLSDAELAPYMPRRADRPLSGLALRVHTYVAQWLDTAPEAAVLSFVAIERDLGISGNRLRAMRHNHKALNRALAGLGLCEVGRSNGRMLGYRHHRQESP